MEEMTRLTKLFEQVGLSLQKAQETLSNKKLTSSLETVIKVLDQTNLLYEAASINTEDVVEKPTGALLYYLASNVTAKSAHQLPYISRAIVSKRLLTNDQVAGLQPHHP